LASNETVVIASTLKAIVIVPTLESVAAAATREGVLSGIADDVVVEAVADDAPAWGCRRERRKRVIFLALLKRIGIGGLIVIGYDEPPGFKVSI
jgi:hypothetical protein